MFFPEKMRKVDILVLRKYAESVSRAVIRFGNLQLIEIDAAAAAKLSLRKTGENPEDGKIHELQRRLGIIKNECMRYETLDLDLDESSTEVPEELPNIAELEKRIEKLESWTGDYHQQIEKIRTKRLKLSVELRKIAFFEGLDDKTRALRDAKFFVSGFGTVPLTALSGFTSAMESLPAVVNTLEILDKDMILFYSAPRKHEEKAEEILKNVYFKDYGLPLDSLAASQKQIRNAFELASLDDEEIWLDKTYEKTARKNRKQLKMIQEFLSEHRAASEIRKESAMTGKVVLFSGWVPEKKVEGLRRKIDALTEGHSVIEDHSAEETAETEGITPPTRLKNPAIIRPFEMLVSLFGMPNYREIDPTPLAALSYTVLYGAMFGDVGHGAAIVALGLLLYFLTRKKSETMRSFGAIMIYIGISAMFFGCLYGEVFGIENFLKPLWLKPMDGIITLMLVAIAFGIGVLSLGIILSMVNSVREKDYKRLLLTSNGLPGLLFYWSIIGVVLLVLFKIKFSPLLWLIPVAGLLVIALESRLAVFFHRPGDPPHEKTSLVVGFVEVFDTVLTFLSKTMSFVRVAAFALNHGALMSVFFLISGMFSNPVVSWIVLLLGNLFVIGFEGFIVAIQALRLEFYEFFVGFFRANGQKFKGLGIYKKD